MNPLQPVFAALAEFHFLRPEWFYALVPAVLLFLLLKARQASSTSWSSAIDGTLLPFLIEHSGETVKRNPFYLLLAGWILATIALAGPVWEKTPQPVHSKNDALVIVLDLSFSMYSIDVKPNRLTRARQKLIDILNQREEGVTGLIVYAGDAHVVSPLTDDANTIASMVPALVPEIMPIYGSALAPALDLAQGMFRDGNVSHGRILVIADDIPDMASAQSIAQANRDHFPVSLLSIGTAQGAPIMLPEQGSLKDSRGVIVIPGVDFSAFKDFADSIGGRYSAMSVSDADLDYLLQETPGFDDEQFRQVERDFDVWQEEGPWLVLLLLPLAALAFRRGWLWCLLLVMLIPGQDSFAENAGPSDINPAASVPGNTSAPDNNPVGQFWQDLWRTRDQQAMDALRNGDASTAARLFNEPAWKGSAHYRGGGYPQAADTFKTLDGADNQYNLGNALARQNKLEDAISAYNKALELDPENEDAKFNKEVVEKLLEQQQQQQQQDQSEDQQKNNENTQSDQNQQSDQQQGEDQQENSNRQQGNDQQDQNQQSPEQQQSAEQQNQDQQDEQEQQQANADEQQQADDGEQSEQQQAQAQEQQIDQEAQQALEQWLRRVPDDPGGLLRRKFEYQAQQRQQQGQGKFKDRDAVW